MVPVGYESIMVGRHGSRKLNVYTSTTSMMYIECELEVEQGYIISKHALQRHTSCSKNVPPKLPEKVLVNGDKVSKYMRIHEPMRDVSHLNHHMYLQEQINDQLI